MKRGCYYICLLTQILGNSQYNYQELKISKCFPECIMKAKNAGNLKKVEL